MFRGLQTGENNRYLKISVTCKHYNVYDFFSHTCANKPIRISFHVS